MKIGTILKNPWAPNNPIQYSVYLGIHGNYFKTVCVYKNKLHYSDYYKKDLDKFEVVGHSDFIQSLRRDIDNAKVNDEYGIS